MLFDGIALGLVSLVGRTGQRVLFGEYAENFHSADQGRSVKSSRSSSSSIMNNNPVEIFMDIMINDSDSDDDKDHHCCHPHHYTR